MFRGVPALSEITTEQEEALYGVRVPAQIEVAGQTLDRPLVSIDLGGITYKILRHPEVIIPPHIKEWIEDYEYTKEFKIPTPFADRNPVWLDLRKQYEAIKGLLGGRQEHD